MQRWTAAFSAAMIGLLAFQGAKAEVQGAPDILVLGDSQLSFGAGAAFVALFGAMRGDCGLDRDATVGVIGVRSSLSAGGSGEPLTEHRVSEGLRQWRDKAGLTEEALGYSLRIYDTRGTAATRLLNHGLILKEIAQHMGWSLRTAADMIKKYARVSADETDAILHKLTAAQRTGTRTEL